MVIRWPTIVVRAIDQQADSGAGFAQRIEGAMEASGKRAVTDASPKPQVIDGPLTGG
jgi:hypothetical protein